MPPPWAAVALRSATVRANHDLRAPEGDGGPERTLAADRYRTIVDVYVLLRRPDGTILLLERSGTGYADGQLCPPSGHLEAGESVVQGAIRETREETGVLIDPADLAFSHVVHHRSPEGQARIGFFFTAVRWQGEPANLEPHKCAALHWADPARPPANTVPYTAAALAASRMEHLSPLTAGDTGRRYPLPDHAGAFAVMPRYGRTVCRKARGIGSSLPRPDAGREARRPRSA